MPNSIGTFTALQDPNGNFTDTCSGKITAVVLSSALTGTLTMTGVNNIDGSPSAWVINPGATGWQAPTGNSSGLFNRMAFVYSNPGADAGKAFALWVAR